MRDLTSKEWKELDDALDYFNSFRLEELKSDDIHYLKIIFSYLPKKELEIVTRESTVLEKSVFSYLNGLREEGKINMFASIPYIMEKFQTGRDESNNLFATWTINFNNECNYNMIKTKKDD